MGVMRLVGFMQTKREISQTEMMLLPSLEERIPADYYLRRMHRVLDLSFVHEAVRDRYCQDNGRPSVDPEVIIRLFLLQAITGCRSVRSLLQEVDMHLGYRWFIGYGATEPLPDHSTLSKALDRFGDEVFNELFTRSIAQCQASGLIEGKVWHVDATTIRADLDRNRVGQLDSADHDARFGRFPGGKLEPGYKQQTVADDARGVVLAVAVQAANESEHDSAVAVIDAATAHVTEPPEVVCADGAYGSGENRAALETRGIRLVSPPPKAVTCTGAQVFTTEDFRYDEPGDVFICPAGETLSYVGGVKGRPKQRRYAASRRVCGGCLLKSRCTRASRRQVKVGFHHAALVRLRADSQTESFRALYRRRAPVIEGVFAEAKQWHGLRRAWRRGLAKMRVQCLLIAAVINFKRLITLLTVPNSLSNTLLNAIITLWRVIVALHQQMRLINRYVLANRW